VSRSPSSRVPLQSPVLHQLALLIRGNETLGGVVHEDFVLPLNFRSGSLMTSPLLHFFPSPPGFFTFFLVLGDELVGQPQQPRGRTRRRRPIMMRVFGFMGAFLNEVAGHVGPRQGSLTGRRNKGRASPAVKARADHTLVNGCSTPAGRRPGRRAPGGSLARQNGSETDWDWSAPLAVVAAGPSEIFPKTTLASPRPTVKRMCIFFLSPRLSRPRDFSRTASLSKPVNFFLLFRSGLAPSFLRGLFSTEDAGQLQPFWL